jgi:hydroxymethylglutaryl-CoA reductase (NADPH)
VAEATTSVGKLNEIEHYCAHNFVYTRFDYSTGDAAGQNMTSRATFVACEWIREQYPTLRNYLLSGNFDTEKRTSSVNMLKNRGTARHRGDHHSAEVLEKHLRITPEAMHYGQGSPPSPPS